MQNPPHILLAPLRKLLKKWKEGVRSKFSADDLRSHNAVSPKIGPDPDFFGSFLRLARRVHRDQRGSISIASVIALLLLVFLLGMVMNSGRQVDQKIKMQNAADAATYAGGVVITRSMNTLAFTNHLLFDVFALTAYMREARDQSAKSLTPEILDEWVDTAPDFSNSEFQKLQALAGAIPQKVQREREMIDAFSAWASAASEMMLPVLEDVLEGRRIPEFQRSLVRDTPRMMQQAADEIAQRHGQAWPASVQLHAALWRTDAEVVGGESDQDNQPDQRTMPVVDPVEDMFPNQQDYKDLAREQRHDLAHRYLRRWNADSMKPFDAYAKMSQFSNLWRVFTCGQLKKLLEDDYPDTNLPHLIRHAVDDIYDLNGHLEHDFMFVGVVYRGKIDDRIPGIFKNRIETDTQAYAQIMLFVPRRRLIMAWGRNDDQQQQGGGQDLGGVPGEVVNLPLPDSQQPPPPEGSDDEIDWYVGRQGSRYHPSHWDLITQNWTMQLVPATAPTLAEILSTPPQINNVKGDLPDYQTLTEDDMRWINHH